MLQAVGHPVLALKRTRVGSLTVGDLAPGKWRRLTAAEVEALLLATEKAAPRRGTAAPHAETPTRRD